MIDLDEDAVRQVVGARIRGAREAAALTQTALAKRLGCAQGLVSSWESGDRLPAVPTLLALARALDVSPGDLLP